MAERSEMCPVASLPLFRLTAAVSSAVLTLNVDSTTRPSSPSSRGCIRGARRFCFSCRVRERNIENPLGKRAELDSIRRKCAQPGGYQRGAADRTLASPAQRLLFGFESGPDRGGLTRIRCATRIDVGAV